ncbi:Gfo/Idh/MocA family oxidoreductase [Terrarubrum flagellatum]|uniref:Gfo/Idh/MocA family protein n=1 Tax=Terrirubrum flagellatum TaxID=2895980 RepID=UPI003144F9F2
MAASGETARADADPKLSNKRRVALVGAGHRGAGTWGRELVALCSDWIDYAGVCDINELRMARARKAIGVDAPMFTDLGEMLAKTRPHTVIVCTPDYRHDDHIVQALEAGCDVITEKPMATTAEKCRRILDAEKRTGRKVEVAFNYRFAPTARTIKTLLASGVIGDIASVDFHWYLDTQHGADYFRRWHAYIENSGSLFVHKATHHFDLLNWYLGADPKEVFARGDLVHYGRNGKFRGTRCKTCVYKKECGYYFDIGKSEWLEMLYEEPSNEDGYLRDACVFREDINIPDTMNASILYSNNVQVSYSLNTFMPIEGYHLAFNGHKGRIEIRQYERQPWETPDYDEILVIKNFIGVERVRVPHQTGGHFGGDVALQTMMFKPDQEDPLGQKAGARAGAMSVLCGVAAVNSMKSGKAVAVEIP